MNAQQADHAARHAALTLALTLPGDTVLYLLLPLYAVTFGVTLPEAGVLLAANRLVRIAGYQWVAKFYATQGPRAACTLAAGAAALSTFGYVMLSGVWALLVARLVWGLAFAALNIANQALPTAVAEGVTRRSGRARAIVAVGPMIGLVGGAIIAEMFGPRPVFMVLGLLALPAILFAQRLPQTPDGLTQSGPRFAWPSALNVWSFCMGLTLDGLFIVGLAIIVAAHQTEGAILWAGLAMALRYASEILLSPAGGALAHRVGARRLLIVLSLGAAAGLALLGAAGWALWVGILVTVILRALMQPLPAPVVAETYPGPARVPALATQATWRDVGAGTGPLIAGLLLPIAPALAIYGAAAAVLAGASLALITRRPRQ